MSTTAPTTITIDDRFDPFGTDPDFDSDYPSVAVALYAAAGQLDQQWECDAIRGHVDDLGRHGIPAPLAGAVAAEPSRRHRRRRWQLMALRSETNEGGSPRAAPQTSTAHRARREKSRETRGPTEE